MRRLFIVFILNAVLLVTAAGGETRVAPDWTLQTAEGHTVTLSEVAAERPVVLLFWATWCPYCKALMPHLQSIDLEYGDRIEILAIHFRDDTKLNGIWGTPGVLIVDRHQNIRFDLYTAAQPELPASDEDMGHRKKAAYRAPYWAAEIRKSLDEVLDETSR
jgi:thiol-disulfide isomerase/thioredoxin